MKPAPSSSLFAEVDKKKQLPGGISFQTNDQGKGKNLRRSLYDGDGLDTQELHQNQHAAVAVSFSGGPCQSPVTIQGRLWRQYCNSRLPFGTRLIHMMRLLSPLDWWRATQFRRASLEYPVFLEAVFTVLLPLILRLWVWQHYRLGGLGMVGVATTTTHSSPIPPLPHQVPALFLPYVCSPLTLRFLHRATRPVAQILRGAYTFHQTTQSTVLPEAWEALREALLEKRAYRTRLYDVYLPPSSLSANHCDDSSLASRSSRRRQNEILPTTPPGPTALAGRTTVAILFLPGMGVSHAAYARPARLLSNHNYVVVVVSGEPWRAVSSPWEFSPEYLSRHILQRVEQLHGSIGRWCLVGHSLGAFTASHLVTRLDHHSVLGMVMWGASPRYWQILKDLSHPPHHGTKNVSVAIVQGSDDVTLRKDDDSRYFVQRLPPTFRAAEHTFWIPGGTHCGFGDYLVTNLEYQEDHSASDRYRQQQQAVNWTHDFFMDLASRSESDVN